MAKQKRKRLTPEAKMAKEFNKLFKQDLKRERNLKRKAQKEEHKVIKSMLRVIELEEQKARTLKHKEAKKSKKGKRAILRAKKFIKKRAAKRHFLEPLSHFVKGEIAFFVEEGFKLFAQYERTKKKANSFDIHNCIEQIDADYYEQLKSIRRGVASPTPTLHFYIEYIPIKKEAILRVDKTKWGEPDIDIDLEFYFDENFNQ